MTTENYIKDNYGLCKRSKCLCITRGWRGRSCPDWETSDCSDFEELKEWQKGVYRRKKVMYNHI